MSKVRFGKYAVCGCSSFWQQRIVYRCLLRYDDFRADRHIVKIQQELNAKARRKALLSAANPVILQNIDNEVIEAENRYKALKARLKADKQAFLQEYPACKVQNTFRMIGRGIIIALMGFIAFLAIDMDELITIIIWFLAAMVIGVMCMMPPYYIKLSPALTELNEAVENAKKYKEYLDRLKKARDEENGV